MRNKLLILFCALFILLFSCSRKSFSLSRESLTRTFVIEGETRKEEALLSFSPNEEGEYTFLLLSPSGDLSWEGKLEKKGEFYSSDSLGITPGASFEEGEYTLYIYSDNGSSIKSSVRIAKEEGEYSYSNAIKKNDASLTLYDSNNNVVDDIVNADRAYISYTDRYSNRVELTIEFDF